MCITEFLQGLTIAPREILKTMRKQNFGGKTKSFMVFLKKGYNY